MGQRIKMGKIKYRMGELFCGAGGLALGAKLARVNANGRSFLIKDVAQWLLNNIIGIIKWIIKKYR